MTYVIAQPCVDLNDKACIEECPVDCIYEGERMLYIHPDECVDCGACEPVCPVEAIFYEDDVPEQWKDYYKANVEFFDDLGSPGGAAKIGKIDKDHPLVAALPPQARASTDAALSAGLGRGCPTSPGTRSRRRPRARAPTLTASSTCRSARRSTPCRRSCRTRWRAASDSPGYPTALGHAGPARRLRGLAGPPAAACRASTQRRRCCPPSAARSWSPCCRRCSGSAPPTWSSCPPLAYPTYAVGAHLVGREVLATDALTRWGRRGPAWSGSTRRPTRPAASCRSSTSPRSSPGRASAARSSCPTSATSSSAGTRTRCPCCTRRCRAGRPTGLLAVHSLSKRSNLAGYRAGLVVGDPALVGEILALRKHLGLLVPAPGAGSAAAALGDDAHVAAQRERSTRAAAAAADRPARSAGFRVDHSEAGLYLWVTRGEPCRDTLRWLADRGILVAPGDFYGAGGRGARTRGADGHRRAHRRRRRPPRLRPERLREIFTRPTGRLHRWLRTLTAWPNGSWSSRTTRRSQQRSPTD